jgi:hypothetical protein
MYQSVTMLEIVREATHQLHGEYHQQMDQPMITHKTAWVPTFLIVDIIQ